MQYFATLLNPIYKFEIKFDIEKNKNEEKRENKNQDNNNIYIYIYTNRGLSAGIIEEYQRIVIRDICYHFYIYVQYTSNF